eukprot:m.739389 g.739389  ORF g.739389 m.739389 type:complete len:163 (-) comp23107_c0_seq10:294-782(-)
MCAASSSDVPRRPSPPPPPPSPSPGHSQYQCSERAPPLPKFCDATIPLATRVDAIVSNLTDAELVNVILTKGGVQRLGIAPYAMWQVESLHGVRLWPERCPFPDKCTTIFPTASASSRGFNRTLWRAIGAAMGLEGRVLFNLGITQDLYVQLSGDVYSTCAH